MPEITPEPPLRIGLRLEPPPVSPVEEPVDLHRLFDTLSQLKPDSLKEALRVAQSPSRRRVTKDLRQAFYNAGLCIRATNPWNVKTRDGVMPLRIATAMLDIAHQDEQGHITLTPPPQPTIDNL